MAGAETVFNVVHSILTAAPKGIVMVAAAAMFAGAATMAGGNILAPRDANAGAGADPASFAERFAGRAEATDCVTRNWPYLGADCLRMPDGSRASVVRVIAIDHRTPAAH